MTQAQNYVELAREAWNEAAPIHWQTTQQLAERFADPDLTFLHKLHADELLERGVRGATVAHLNCNNGRELISIARLGARAGVGFDISGGFVAQARELAAAAGTEGFTFEETDVYAIDARHDGQFDFVVITAGALCFMPDLEAYFAVARRLLRPGGHLSIYESHPITDTLLLDRDRGDAPLTFVRSYFEKDPIEHRTGLDYIHNEPYEAKPIYYFRHTLSDIFEALLGLGFALERFVEHDQDPSQAFQRVEAMDAKPPLSFLLTARAPGQED